MPVVVGPEHIVAVADAVARVDEQIALTGCAPMMWVAELSRSRGARRRAVLANPARDVTRSARQWVDELARLGEDGHGLHNRVAQMRRQLAAVDSRLVAIQIEIGRSVPCGVPENTTMQNE